MTAGWRTAPAGRASIEIALLGMALAAVGGARAALGAGPDDLLRHAYAVPVVVAAMRLGVPGGALAALAGAMLEAPRIFAGVERGGLATPVAEAAVSALILLGAGVLVGALAGEASRQRRRYETLLCVQDALAQGGGLDETLERLRAILGVRLGAEVGLAVRDGDRIAIAGGRRLAPASPAARAFHAGVPVFVRDVGGAPRARRAFAAPMLVRGQSIGALVVERDGEIGAAERTALATLAVAVALALENGRLAERQRRFTAELEEKVAAATRHLATMDRAKSRLLALASHELRTPLTTLLGFSELLAVRAYAAADVRRLAGIMRRETERLARLVDDFLDLERLERGQELRLRRTAVAVPAALEGVAELFRHGRATHRLEVACEGDVPAVDADPDALDRILKNLVANAIKYSPAGSRVRLSARRRGPAVEIAVEDEGRGIPPDVRPRIFEPYFRAPDAAAAASGSGIGLAVVKSLVDAHGGRIDVGAAPGTGTRFVLELPVVP